MEKCIRASVVPQPANELKGTTEIKEESDPRGRHCARDLTKQDRGMKNIPLV
jgi:hypothetical protein